MECRQCQHGFKWYQKEVSVMPCATCNTDTYQYWLTGLYEPYLPPKPETSGSGEPFKPDFQQLKNSLNVDKKS